MKSALSLPAKSDFIPPKVGFLPRAANFTEKTSSFDEVFSCDKRVKGCLNIGKNENKVSGTQEQTLILFILFSDFYLFDHYNNK